MRESRTYGSGRGARGNSRPYRERPLHVSYGSFASKATEAVRPCISATPPKADVNSPPRLSPLSATSRLAPHSITSSASASIMGGMSRPSALAVLRLITNSNLVGCMTGRLAGFSPLRTLPA